MVGVIFGGRSVEHEVSVITAYQVIEVLKGKFSVAPIYITKDGEWILVRHHSFSDFKASYPKIKGKRVYVVPGKGLGVGLFKRLLPLDVVIPLVHGTYGEDGTLQGLLELINIPYIGSGVVGSAICMDKVMAKRLFSSAGLPVLPYLWFKKSEDRESIIERIERELSYPLFVKPANLGSSIGVNIVRNRDDLEFALDVAFSYDLKVIAEKALEGAKEINCAVLEGIPPVASVCEEPVSWSEFLSFEDKYIFGGKEKGMKGSGRKIPADIPDQLREKIQGMAISAFSATDCRGVVRVDFLVKNEDVYINEINTIPGSLSFYLWKAAGIQFSELLDRLILLAKDIFSEKSTLFYKYDSQILC
jgi:D-alanine-D-alanine ligase